ncbi:recombinase family protein [Microbacterium sp.]|uniref:recombinase family protein n=1 Tax=Microbacterium sp. TaxID=51671 RepID=UPI00281275FB|nr:recombinase family protein [Microbacterium sp.]
MPRSLRPVTDAAPRAIIYLRQSAYRDESISLELQEIACRDYCDRMGYEVTAVEADPGITGRTWNRPAVQRVMAAIDARGADVIVLWKWSRLSRSRKDWALAIDRADVAGGKIESATEPIDTATASGRFARGVMTEYAAFQSEQIGEQWEEVRQRRLRLGLPASGRLPFGWQWDQGAIKPHAEHAPIVVEMYRRYLSGDGAASIAAWLNASGIPAPRGGTWRRTRPLTVMDSPIHAGLIPYRGDTYPGKHDAIIDESTWAAYQGERKRRADATDKPRAYQHLLSSMIFCECGARMHGKGSYTGGKLYRGYLCSDTLNGHEQRAYVSALTVEPLVVDWLLQFDPEVEGPAGDGPVLRSRHDAILRELNALEVEVVNLTRQHTRGIIPESAYVRSLAEITAEIERRQTEERRMRPSPSASPEQIATLQAAWTAMSMAAQNKGLRQVVSRIDVLPGGRKFIIKTTWGASSEVHA